MTQRGNVIRRPRKWRENEPVSASKLEELRDGLDRLIDGTETRQLSTLLPPTAQVFQGEIVGLESDYIIVVELRIYAGGGTIKGTALIPVAKPWFLRRTPFDGQSRDGVSYTYTNDQQRTAIIGPDTRVEHVTPGYLIGDIAYCVQNVHNATGVETGGSLISALEIESGRMWAADPPPS